MTVGELLELLSVLPEEMEVKLAQQQPAWSFEYSIAGAELVDDEDGTPTLWLAEGTQRGYLSAAVAEALGW